jgi:hypothetical protein
MKTQSSTSYARLLGACAALSIPFTSSLQAQNTLVDLELSLVTDVSGSVSNADYQLMMNGYADAFRSPTLISAIGAGAYGGIAVNLVFFASSAAEGIPFTYISNTSEADAFATVIDGLVASRPGNVGSSTSISTGLDLATQLFSQNSFDAPRVVIDVAGDGTGSTPGVSRDNAIANGVTTINGIVIGTDPGGSLAKFYEDEVIAGDGAFVAVAPTFEDFEPEILSKIEREVRGDYPSAETGRIMTSTLRMTSVTVARTATRDVGDRLFRLRSGVRSEPMVTTQPAPAPSAKGGMAKGGMAKTPITITETCPWEVYGQVFYSAQDLDAQYLYRPAQAGTAFVAPQLLQPETSIDIFGGTVGFDYDFNENFTAGFAISASRADADMSLVGDMEIDNVSLMPYVSYYRPLGGMAFYADLLYGYGMNDYDTMRLPLGTSGSTEGDFHTLEFNTGLNIQTGQWVHGPLAQVRWVDGEIDSYTEIGPGALVFPEADYESLATQLGYQVSYPMPMASGTLVPQFRAAWEHEFEADQGNLAGFPLGGLDEDLAVIGAGIGYFMNCGWNVVLDYEARVGSESESHYVGLKVGKEF